MNIFFTSYDPFEAASCLDNKRLNKMILESAQMLSTALQDEKMISGLYKPTHVNHPCNVWLRKSYHNCHWVAVWALEMAVIKEDKTNKVHKSVEVILNCLEFLNKQEATWTKITPPPNCTDYKDVKDVCLAYKMHLLSKWENDLTNNRNLSWSWTGFDYSKWSL